MTGKKQEGGRKKGMFNWILVLLIFLVLHSHKAVSCY